MFNKIEISPQNIKNSRRSKKNLNIILDSKNSGTNNSSYNFLSQTNSKFFKDKLNNNSNLINNFSNKLMNVNKNINIFKNEENKDKENIPDIILNQSNKILLFVIKIYSIAMLIIIIIIEIFNAYKIKKIGNYIYKFDNFFSDFEYITNRYSISYYYFNTLRTLLIFPDDHRKKKFENIMEGMGEYYEIQNKEFLDTLSKNKNTFTELISFFNMLMENKYNSTDTIIDKICSDEDINCLKDLEMTKNIFESGIDFVYKTCINKIYNIFSDYQKLNNKTDIREINSSLISSNNNSEFTWIELSLSNLFFYVKENIYYYFELYIEDFIESFDKKMSLLSIISIISCVLTFLLAIIFMFINIFGYSNSIKESSYRINCSFYYIKRYSINN